MELIFPCITSTKDWLPNACGNAVFGKLPILFIAVNIGENNDDDLAFITNSPLDNIVGMESVIDPPLPNTNPPWLRRATTPVGGGVACACGVFGFDNVELLCKDCHNKTRKETRIIINNLNINTIGGKKW